ncbi:hypothetical protein Tco_1155643 [Tanacetum coccineum]
MKQRSRRPKRKDTHVPQSSVPSDNVVDKAVNEEMDDSLERAATTATSLDAEQDRGNIAKTQSKATPNEPSSPGTSSGSGLRRQETMRDTIAQTRSENVSKLSNDPLLSRETTKTTQANEIASLKRRVKKLERMNRSRTHGLKRLYKVGLTARVESSGDEEGLGEEDVSKQGRIANIDADAGINLKLLLMLRKQEVLLEKILVLLQQQLVLLVKLVTTADELTLAQALAELKSARPPTQGISFREPSKDTTTITTTTITAAPKPLQDKGKGIMIEEPVAKVKADYQLAQRLQAEEQEGLSVEEKVKLFQQLLEKRRKHFAAKRAEEKRNKPPTQAQQRKIMSTYLKNMEGWKPKDLKNKSFDSIQKMFEKSMKRVNTFVDYRNELVEESSKKAEAEIAQESSLKRAGDELEQENAKKQKVDEDKETTKLQSLMEVIPDEEEIAVDAIPLATKPPTIVDWKIHKEEKKSYYKIIRADGSSKMYRVFSLMLKSFDKEDLETLYKLVKAKYGLTRPVEDLDLILYGDLKTMFEPNVEDQVWKNQDNYKVLDWKLYDSCGVHSLRKQNVYIHMLVEKRYPLTLATIIDMLNRKLQADHWNEMCYQLLKLITK